MANPFAIYSKGVQARYDVVAWRHRDLEEVRCSAETVPGLVYQTWMRSVVEEDISFRVPDQVEEVGYLNGVGAVRVERVVERANRLLSTAVECVHLHRGNLLGQHIIPIFR